MVREGGPGRNRVKPSAQRPTMTQYYRGAPKESSPFVPKIPRRSWHARLTRYIDWLLILIVIFCCVYSLLIKPDPKVIASSNDYRSISTYQAAAAEKLRNIKDRTKLSFDETELILSLQKQFPEIASAQVELPIIGQKPIIRLTIAKPEFLFRSQGQTYILASDGVLVVKAAGLSTAQDLPLINDLSGYKPEIGKTVISSSEVSFIAEVAAQCHKATVPIGSLTLPAAAQELDLKTADKNYTVKFYLGGDPLLQSGQFLAARHQFAETHQDPSQYLDVRVAGKVFYK